MTTDSNLPSADGLRDILNALGIPLAYVLPAFQSSRQRGPALIQALNTSHRMARSDHDWEQLALIEFHMGLYNMEWGEFRGAAYNFRDVQRYNKRTNDPLLTYLAQFAEATMHQRIYNYESAAQHFRAIYLKMRRFRAHLQAPGLHPSHDRAHHFMALLEEAILLAQGQLHRTMTQPLLEERQPAPRVSASIPIPEEDYVAEEPVINEELFEEAPIQSPYISLDEEDVPTVHMDDEPTPIIDINDEARTPYQPHDVSIEPPRINFGTPAIHRIPPSAIVSPNPVPAYISLSPGLKLFPIVETHSVQREFLPEVQESDWLLVDTSKRTYSRDELIVLGDKNRNVRGSVRLGERIRMADTTQKIYAARFVRDATTNKIEFIADDRAENQIERRDNIIGSVIGYFRHLPKDTLVFDNQTPPVNPLVLDYFEAPVPEFFEPTDDAEVFYITRKEPSQFLGFTRPGDSLIVNTQSAEHYEPGQLVVIDGHINGSVHLSPTHTQPTYQHYAAQHRIDENTGLSTFVSDGAPPATLTPNLLIVGAIIGYFRYL